MSFDHHSEKMRSVDEIRNKARLLDQMIGRARREYPAGRMGADDDGLLSYAVAAPYLPDGIAVALSRMTTGRLIPAGANS